MTWVIVAIIIFLFYAKSIGMAWFVIMTILFAIMGYFISGFFDDLSGPGR